MINDLKFNGQGYYIPAYPQHDYLPEYLKNLKEPVVFISENFDGKPPVDELAVGKFLSEKTHGAFITSPGSGLMAQMEKQLQLDFSKIDIQELMGLLPRCLTEQFNLAKSVDMTFLENGINFKATGILFESLYRTRASFEERQHLRLSSCERCCLCTCQRLRVKQSLSKSRFYRLVTVVFMQCLILFRV